MNLRTLTVFLWGFLIATAAVAGEEHKTEIKIEITSDGSEPHSFKWHSNDPNADFSTMEVGETRTLEGGNGKEVAVTKTEDGLVFDIDGKKIDVIDFHGDGYEMIDMDEDVHVEKDIHVEKNRERVKIRVIKKEIENTTD